MKLTTFFFGILWCIIAIVFFIMLLTGVHKEVSDLESTQKNMLYGLSFAFFASSALAFYVLSQKIPTLTEEDIKALYGDID